MEFNEEEKMYREVLQKAWDDNDFKQRLVNDPEAALSEFTGQEISLLEGKKIVVNDQTDETVVYINIPRRPNLDDIELNEEQLETIAGGGSLLPTLPILPLLPILILIGGGDSGSTDAGGGDSSGEA
jgi:hypothetical protein